ncbi:MAG: NAD(P)/FAD-dependent oxidoreductase [Rhodobacteraceae bacterium]|nr:NAD(P)/FAD-dependent oxidoreductase [Paracoccaceae bacterium]
MMQDRRSSLSSTLFDVVVIGAGVVGCAMARRFTLEGARVALVEKACDILDGASKANSAILHTGFDAPVGSIELDCIRKGGEEYRQIHQDMRLPLDAAGAYVVAWNDAEVARLDTLLEQAHTNGISNATLVGQTFLRDNEPHLSDRALAAISVPGEALIDPWSAPYAYLKQALQNGAEVFLKCEVTGGGFAGGEWQLETSRGVLNCRQVINCAGLYGDYVDQAVLGQSDFLITPRKGQFLIFDKAAASLLQAIILPVPTARTKGVVVCRTIFGNLLVGPTADEQQSRHEASTDTVSLEGLMQAAIRMIPALADMPITATYAGLRPATEQKEYRIIPRPDRNWITVGGIRSTGLSAALGIAQHVFAQYQDWGAAHEPLPDPKVPQANILAEQGARAWRQGGQGDMICHCELVREAEIRQALTGPLAARSLAGLKRQTRVTMGRCQGFYCSARLTELTDGHFDIPLAKDIKHD